MKCYTTCYTNYGFTKTLKLLNIVYLIKSQISCAQAKRMLLQTSCLRDQRHVTYVAYVNEKVKPSISIPSISTNYFHYVARLQ